MNEFDDAIDAALAQREAAGVPRGADAADIARIEWDLATAALRASVRDALVRRDLPRTTGRLEKDSQGRKAEGEVSGWPLPGFENEPDWFIDVDANFYTFRFMGHAQMNLYLKNSKVGWFHITGPTRPDSSRLEDGIPVVRFAAGERSFEAELLRRVVGLISRLDGRTHSPRPRFTTASGEPVGEVDLPEEVRARFSE